MQLCIIKESLRATYHTFFHHLARRRCCRRRRERIISILKAFGEINLHEIIVY